MEWRELYPDMPVLLASVRQRPGMWLGRKTISGLHLLLIGIRFAEDFHSLAEPARFGGFDAAGFEGWVESRFNPRGLSLDSYSLSAHLAGSEASGFDLWFSWYDRFNGDPRKEGQATPEPPPPE
ncbi:MAG: hypothetical protein ACRC33_25170 [Gemmataceae bacterium]